MESAAERKNEVQAGHDAHETSFENLPAHSSRVTRRRSWWRSLRASSSSNTLRSDSSGADSASSDVAGFVSCASEWNALAYAARSPFLTVQWLSAWWRAFGQGTPKWIIVRGPEGELRAGSFFAYARGTLTGTANYHSGLWDVVARDTDARAELYTRIAASGRQIVVLPTIPDDHESAGVAQAVLSQSGYRVVREAGARSPYCRLPGTYEELLASTSRNLRSQLGRRRRALEREGRLVFRTVKRPHDLESNLDSVFWVEGSGWKTARSTAILSDPRTRRFYTELAHAAAAEGWLRLHLLELDGVVIAADYALAFAGGEFLLKTGFNQSYSRRSPGFVLRGAVLRSAIEEGLAFYDFLGGAEPYKLRWASQIRPRVTLRAYHGAAAMPRFAYSARVRPRLKAIHARARRGHGPA